MATKPKWTGTKKDLIKECIAEIGTTATFAQVLKWARINYGETISNPQYYTTRREVLDEENNRIPTPTLKTGDPNGQFLKSISEQVAQRVTQLHPAPANTESGIVSLVKTARALVEKLGKAEAKNLIDAI